VTKTFRFQSLALVASMGLCAVLISGCNPEEPVKPVTPGPTTTATKPAPAPAKTEAKAPAAAPAPTKEADKPK